MDISYLCLCMSKCSSKCVQKCPIDGLLMTGFWAVSGLSLSAIRCYSFNRERDPGMNYMSEKCIFLVSLLLVFCHRKFRGGVQYRFYHKECKMANINSSKPSLSSSHVSEVDWQTLYTLLNSLATRAVYTLRISLGYGQERDIVEDVVQETLVRLLERIRKGERGEATPVAQVERMAAVIAFNCCRDLRRHDRRVVHFPDSVVEFEDRYLASLQSQRDCSEDATEQVFLEALFSLLAHEVMCFPTKQKRALLVDLATTMFFDPQPSPLQQAFLAVGIDLREYQQSVPENFKARSQHTALLYWAFKRMHGLPSVQNYIAC
jgi:DNA-directed RNA polymerase specialized sigma24 family protein